MSVSGHELRESNEKILKLMETLKKQRDELCFLIEKQEQEKRQLQIEIEKMSYKLTSILRSLNQRLETRENYDKTIKDVEEYYEVLVKQSVKFLSEISSEVNNLESIMDKRTSTARNDSKKQNHTNKLASIVSETETNVHSTQGTDDINVSQELSTTIAHPEDYSVDASLITHVNTRRIFGSQNKGNPLQPIRSHKKDSNTVKDSSNTNGPHHATATRHSKSRN